MGADPDKTRLSEGAKGRMSRVARCTALSSIILLWRSKTLDKHRIKWTCPKANQKSSKGGGSSFSPFTAKTAKMYCFGQNVLLLNIELLATLVIYYVLCTRNPLGAQHRKLVVGQN